MGINFLKIAVIYLVIGTLLGFTMGITQKFVLVPVHAHLLLLSTTRLARFHFWLHNLGLPVFMLGLGLLLTGSHSALPLAIIGAIAVLLGLVLFAANVLLNIKSAALSV